jgi:threonine/homoserine/homoserine lactone efflux protein
MPPLDRLLPFALAAFALIVIPGPSVLYVVSRGVTLGRRAALASVAGNALGEYVQVIGVAFGLGLVLERSIVVFTVVKLAGAGYLVYLGVRTFVRRRELPRALSAAPAAWQPRRVLRDGFVVGLTNPKTTVFFAAILPQFADARSGHLPLQFLVLGLVFMAIALVSDSMWGLAAGTARAWFDRSPRRLERVGAASGLVTIGLGLRLALLRRTD